MLLFCLHAAITKRKDIDTLVLFLLFFPFCDSVDSETTVELFGRIYSSD